MRIIGCGHKITANDTTKPVITVESTAGKADGTDMAFGAEKDIQIEDLNVLKGTKGFVIQTTMPGGVGTSTLLKSIRSDTNKNWGIEITGDGNEVRGANSVGTNGTTVASDGGIKVTGNGNLLRSNRVASNKGDGINVTGSNNTIIDGTVGGKGTANSGNGIWASNPSLVSGSGNIIHDNDVEANTKTGIVVLGRYNQVYKNDVGDKGTGNGAGGIYVGGDYNTLGMALNENDVFGNTGIGIQVVGNYNTIAKNDVGDDGKGNAGDGINVNGYGNLIDANNVMENGGDGIDVSGGTMAKPNVISNNNVGDRGKGNLGDGIVVGNAADDGNGTMDPVEINGNTVRSNRYNGINVKTYGHQLANNVSGGTGSYSTGGQDNGKCEFLVAANSTLAKYNFNAGGNVANGVAVSLPSAWPPAPSTTTTPNCQGTP